MGFYNCKRGQALAQLLAQTDVLALVARGDHVRRARFPVCE
jgi:hypothetical protein